MTGLGIHSYGWQSFTGSQVKNCLKNNNEEMGMSDSEMIKQLIEDRIKLEAKVNDLIRTLQMAENLIQKGKDSNYDVDDVKMEIARSLVYAEAQ
jgi:hypothetical protein